MILPKSKTCKIPKEVRLWSNRTITLSSHTDESPVLLLSRALKFEYKFHTAEMTIKGSVGGA